MKKSGVVVLALLFAVPIYARNPRIRPHRADFADPVVLNAEPVPDGVNLALRVVAQLHASRQQKRPGVGAQAITYNGSARAVLIPAAGSVRGGGGTFFRSDITFVNWNVADQRTLVLWLQNGASGPQTFSTTIPGDRPPFTVNDFVGTTLHLSGLGALLFVPVNAAGNPDPDAAIDIYSRIWTPQPNATGTVSQPFPGVDPDNLTGDYEAFILGLRQDSAYRTNFGIVNLNNYQLKFLVTVFPESAAPGTQLQEIAVTLPPLTMTQQPLSPSTLYATGVNLLVEVDETVPGNNQSWASYASSTDNITGDGWVSIAGHDYDDESLDDHHLSRGVTPRSSATGHEWHR